MLHWKNKVGIKVLPWKEIIRSSPQAGIPRIARSYSQFKDGKTHQIQAGVLSAVKGAIHYLGECNETYSDTSLDICFFVPIFVVDGQIFECYFEEGSAELLALEAEQLVYMQNYVSPSYGRISVRVPLVTLSALPAMIAAYENWGKQMLQCMGENRHHGITG